MSRNFSSCFFYHNWNSFKSPRFISGHLFSFHVPLQKWLWCWIFIPDLVPFHLYSLFFFFGLFFFSILGLGEDSSCKIRFEIHKNRVESWVLIYFVHKRGWLIHPRSVHLDLFIGTPFCDKGDNLPTTKTCTFLTHKLILGPFKGEKKSDHWAETRQFFQVYMSIVGKSIEHAATARCQ